MIEVNMIAVTQEAGRDRLAQIFTDVMDYHADEQNLEVMSEQANIKQLVLYHLVPIPINGMTFELPANNDSIVITP